MRFVVILFFIPVLLQRSIMAAPISLQDWYRKFGEEKRDDRYPPLVLYETLIKELKDPNLVKGLLVNVHLESEFFPYIVSRKPGEVSLGLWQFNVKRKGWWGVPEKRLQDCFHKSKRFPYLESIMIPDHANVVPYFVGGLLLERYGLTPIDPKEFCPADVFLARLIFEVGASPDRQIDFVVQTTRKMLAAMGYKDLTKLPKSIDMEHWAVWFLVYFEQPSAVISGERLERAFRAIESLFANRPQN